VTDFQFVSELLTLLEHCCRCHNIVVVVVVAQVLVLVLQASFCHQLQSVHKLFLVYQSVKMCGSPRRHNRKSCVGDVNNYSSQLVTIQCMNVIDCRTSCGPRISLSTNEGSGRSGNGHPGKSEWWKQSNKYRNFDSALTNISTASSAGFPGCLVLQNEPSQALISQRRFVLKLQGRRVDVCSFISSAHCRSIAETTQSSVRIETTAVMNAT